MKKNFFKRGMAGLLSLVMCLTALVGIGTTTAYAAGERAEVYLVSFPRSGDANIDYSGTWGHPNLRYMNGWHSGESKYTTIRAMHSYDGNICYCIEPGVQQDTGDTYASKDETFWDNLPSDINSTISPYDIKLFIGRIMQYGYTGPISTSWRSQNPADAATLAEAMATQVLIWETVVGERDEDFDYVSPGSYDAVKGVISTAHPLYDLFCDYYDSIEASVQRHSAIPSFMSKNPNRAQSVELEWDGSSYTATLTDHNRVLSDYSFSANEDGISFSVNGNQLIITATDAPSDSVRITANKVGSTRRGIITWTDGRYAPGGGIQDVVSYAQEVNDPVQAFLNLKVSYGAAKIVKTSEDGKVDNLTFKVNWDYFILLVAKTGMRFSEALALTPKDFDFAHQTLSISKTWDYKGKGGFQPTKNKSSVRKIQIDWQTVIQFSELVKHLPEDKPIFVNSTVYNSTVNDILGRHCKACNIPVISIHGLRHTHASLLLFTGVSIASVARRLGHSSMTTTQKTYLHIIQELENKDIDLVMRSLSGLS